MGMSQTAVRLPRLLRRQTDGTYREIGRLRPAALSVTLNLTPLSTADMTLCEDDLPVRMHDLVELYGQNGSLGLYRVVNLTTAYGKQRRLRLNHALDTLSDDVLPGEETITGTAGQALQRILAGQGGTAHWRLGMVEDSANVALDCRYDTLIGCLQKLAESEDGYYFSCDFSAFPWTLHFLRKNDAVLSEFRLTRNVENCQVTLDDSALCTRLYLSVDTTVTDENGSRTVTAQEVHDDAAAQAIWGVVSKTENLAAERVADRTAWVQAYFARHSQPGLQIAVDGLELNRLTGEALDEMHLGRICRVALPEYGAVFEERIVSMAYADLLRRPEAVTVSLVNRRADAGRAFAGLAARSSAHAAQLRSSRRETESIRYSWRATDRHVTDMGEILHAAGLEIDPHGVWLYAGENAASYALGASFRVQAEQISGIVSRTGIGSLGQNETLYSRISQTAEQISSKVSKSDFNGNTIVSEINQTATTVSISAQRINLSGYVTASELNVQKARIDNLIGGTQVDALKAGTISAVNHLMFDGHGAYWLSAKDGSGNTIWYLGRRT